MSCTILHNANEFVSLFALGQEYASFIPLIDRRVGFSVQRAYPSDIRYAPPITDKGVPDVVALIHVIYEHPDETGEASEACRAPITVTVGAHSRFLSKHVDYLFQDPLCPTEESVRASRQTPEPIALSFFNEFFYNRDTGQISDSKGRVLTGRQVLDEVFQAHCDTVHLIKGLRIRWRLRWKSGRFAAYGLVIAACAWLLTTAFGRKLQSEDSISSSLRGYKRSDLKKLRTDVLDILGYRASKNVIVTFCVVVAAFSLLAYSLDFQCGYLSSVSANTFLGTIYVILALTFLDSVAPWCVFGLMNWLIRRRLKGHFK